MGVTTGQKCALCSLFGICNIIFLVLAVGIAMMSEGAVEEKLLEPQTLPQVKDLINDWNAVPFVAIAARETCEEGEEDVFVKTWAGTERGCEIEEGANSSPRSGWKDLGNKLADCELVEAVDPIMQGVVVNGKRFCGKRGGKSYSEVTRVDAGTGECPTDTTPCSDETSPENTVCYPPADHETSCPITEIQVVDQEGLAGLENQGVVASDEGGLAVIETGALFLAYSKIADAPPVSLTFVGAAAPCRDAEKMLGTGSSTTEEAADDTEEADVADDDVVVEDVASPMHYPLEVDRLTEMCTSDNIDARYTMLNLSTTEFALEASSGVADAIKTLPGGETWITNSEEQKSATTLTVYYRNALPWDLTCEAERPRDMVMEIMEGTTAKIVYSGITLKLFGWIMFGGGIIIAMFTVPNLFEENASKTVTTVAIVLLQAFQICMTVSTMFFLTTTLGKFDDRVDATNRLAVVNGCGDEYTVVPFIDLQRDFDKTEENLNQLITITVLMIVASLFVGVLTIPAYHCVHYVADLGDGRGFYAGADDIEAEFQKQTATTDGKVAARKIQGAN